MKTLIFFAVTVALFSCKKKSNTTTTSADSVSDTCKSNPKINFSSKGTPIGKFNECIKDIEGNVYKTVTIGAQTWMAENLKVSKYSDGTTIPNITDNTQWSQLTTGAWVYYNNDDINNTKYGKLYNWYAVSKTSNGNKNVCPLGWHVPTDAEWTILTDYLGGENVAGGKMKEIGTSSWNSPNADATNTSLFNALPGGIHSQDIVWFYNIGKGGYWWSSIEKEINASLVYKIDHEFGGIMLFSKTDGLSVRCLKD